MSITAKIKIGLGLMATLLVTACATGTGSGGNMDMQTVYERTIPVCVGANDCRLKMDAARDWVKNNTGFQLLVDTDDRIETGGWAVADFTAVRIDRAPIGSDRYWILVEINCGSDDSGADFGAHTCPPYWETVVNFNQVVSAAN